MSSSQDNKTSKFIPILTEIIEDPVQNNLDLYLEGGAEEHLNDQDRKGRVSVSFFDDQEPFPEVEITSDPAYFSSITSSPSRVEPELEKKPSFTNNAFWQRDTKADDKDVAATQVNTDWQDRPSIPNREKTKETESNPIENPDSIMHFDRDESVEKEVFSPLSHSPIAKEDQLRPSDLMLVALTERIASKVRMRVSKDLDTHIQNKIFPLLDSFADQLVKHLEIDLLKLIREGIAEATREELERLSQRSKK